MDAAQALQRTKATKTSKQTHTPPAEAKKETPTESPKPKIEEIPSQKNPMADFAKSIKEKFEKTEAKISALESVVKEVSDANKKFDSLRAEKMIKGLIEICRKKKKYVGICGDAPSTLEGFSQFLVEAGIEAISLSPDAVMKTILNLARLKNN